MQKKRSIKNIILKVIVGMLIIVFFASGSALDSNYGLEAMAVCLTSFAILTMLAIANGAMNWGVE